MLTVKSTKEFNESRVAKRKQDRANREAARWLAQGEEEPITIVCSKVIKNTVQGLNRGIELKID